MMDGMSVAAVVPLGDVPPLTIARERPVARLEDVFTRCADALYGFILVRVGGDRHVADDLLQQTCCEAAGNGRFPHDEQECEAWFFGIARNLVRRRWRTQRRRWGEASIDDQTRGAALVERMEAGPLDDSQVESREDIAQLMLAITALPAADQRLVYDFYFDARSQAQIAVCEGGSIKSVESRLYRIRTRLRAMLRGAGKER